MAGPRKGSLDEIDQMLLDAADGIFEVEVKIEDTVKTNPRKPKYICADCSKTHTSAKALGNHYLRTHLEGDSPCEHCTTDQSCARHHVYYNWVRMSSDPKPHQCLLCSECFGTPTMLRAHQCSARPGNRRKPKESSRRTIVRVETTPVPDSERAHYGMPWPAPTRQWGPAPAPAPVPAPALAPAAQDDRMRIGFVLQNVRRMDVDFVPLDSARRLLMLVADMGTRG
jgi:hypothetical protein